ALSLPDALPILRKVSESLLMGGSLGSLGGLRTVYCFPRFGLNSSRPGSGCPGAYPRDKNPRLKQFRFLRYTKFNKSNVFGFIPKAAQTASYRDSFIKGKYMEQAPVPRSTIGEALVAEGAITPEQLTRALKVQQLLEEPKQLVDVLVELGYAPRKTLTD